MMMMLIITIMMIMLGLVMMITMLIKIMTILMIMIMIINIINFIMIGVCKVTWSPDTIRTSSLYVPASLFLTTLYLGVVSVWLDR